MGVRFDYLPALSRTTERILGGLDNFIIQNLTEVTIDVLMASTAARGTPSSIK